MRLPQHTLVGGSLKPFVNLPEARAAAEEKLQAEAKRAGIGQALEGTVVTATVNGRAMRRDLRVGFSYLAANSSRIHFGLGDATRIDDVVVQWLDGTRESFGSFDAGQVVALRRGQAPAN